MDIKTNLKGAEIAHFRRTLNDIKEDVFIFNTTADHKARQAMYDTLLLIGDCIASHVGEWVPRALSSDETITAWREIVSIVTFYKYQVLGLPVNPGYAKDVFSLCEHINQLKTK